MGGLCGEMTPMLGDHCCPPSCVVNLAKHQEALTQSGGLGLPVFPRPVPAGSCHAQWRWRKEGQKGGGEA